MRNRAHLTALPGRSSVRSRHPREADDSVAAIATRSGINGDAAPANAPPSCGATLGFRRLRRTHAARLGAKASARLDWVALETTERRNVTQGNPWHSSRNS